MACGSCGKRDTADKYEHTDASGRVTVYGSEIEARAAVARRGGSYKPVK